jgi:hypothetical protein
VGIGGSAGTLMHDLEPFGDEHSGHHGDDQDQTFETGGITDIGLFQTQRPLLSSKNPFTI